MESESEDVDIRQKLPTSPILFPVSLHTFMNQSRNEHRTNLRGSWQKYLVGVLVLELLLIGCTDPVPALSPTKPSTPARPSPNQGEIAVGQQLPIGATVKIGDQLIQLEVAKTVEQQAIGLMYRTELADNRGMLFPFEYPRRASFWMKNCLISLDMVFLRDGKVQSISSNVPPCQEDPCPTYGPNVLVDQVIELRGGRAAELGVKVGDRLEVQSQ